MDRENDYRDLFELAPVAYLEIDGCARLRRVNEAACRLFGYSREDLSRLELFDLLHPDAVELAKIEFPERLKGNLISEPFERRFIRADGKLLICEVHVAVISGESEAAGVRVAVIDLTARRQAEAAESGVLDSALDAIVIIDGEGAIAQFNPAAETIFGYKREQVIGKKLVDTIIPPSLRERHQNTFLRHMKTGECVYLNAGRVELTGMRSDGSEFPVELSIRKLDIPDRTLFVGFMRDISERVRDRERIHVMIQELDFHRVRWETTLKQMPGGVLVIDADGRIMLTNDWMQKLLKRPLPDLESCSLGGHVEGWRMANGSPYPVNRWPPLRALINGETIVREEIIFDVDEQVQAYMEVSASPIVDAGSRVIAAGCIFFDVTAQRLSERSLRDSEARYRDIFEQDAAANFILSRRLELVGCNSAAVALFGYDSKQQMFDSSLAGEFPSEADRTAILTEAERPLDKERRYMRLHRRNGSPVLVVGRLKGGRDSKGRLIEIHGHFVDITERRRAERKVTELSAQLMKAQNEERRKLSHDLHDSTGQDLSALSMNLGLIEASLQTSPEKSLMYLNECKSLVQACIQDIRTVSYLLHPPLLTELGLGAALAWFIEGFSKRSSIQVSLEVMEGLGRLGTLVELAFFRIAQEALSNVHRHSGSKTATVRLWRDPSQLTLTISDQGVGIQSSAGRAEPGAGVGLASIRQQLSLVNGTLEISSGMGTTLTARITYESITRDV